MLTAHAILSTLRQLVVATFVLSLVTVALLAMLAADRWAFRLRRGRAALDAFDAACSRIDRELDRPPRVIPIDVGHRRLVRRAAIHRPPRGAA